MNKFTSSNKNYIKILFMLGALLGAVSFCVVYGIKVLDFTNTGWLFYGDNDLRQHYIAWCNYRRDPWHFPIGLIDSLSYPNSMSVIYTDSIPVFAVIFKLFGSALPQTFQYFGLFGILSFMLMGGLSAVLLARFIDNPVICVVGSEFYIMSFTVIQRLYYHTALAAQWIIILALILWVYDKTIEGPLRKSLIWGGMAFLCVSIHSYFLPMVGMILAALCIQQFIDKYSHNKSVPQSLKLPAMEVILFCVFGLLNLWILGGFYGESSGYAGGLGTFNSNLNTFINPIDYGKMLPRLQLFNDFQYEGMGYLGAGIIFLFIIVAVGMVFRMVRKVPEEAFHSSRVPGLLSLAVVLCSIMAATLPLLSFNDKKIVWLPYPDIVERVLGIFRSNGRFIWVAMYILMTAAISFLAYTFRHYRSTAIVIIAMAIILQLYDGSNMYKEKRNYFTGEYPIFTMWDDPELAALADGKRDFIFLYNDNDVTLYTAYYGYLHGMRQNNYYYARGIDDQIEENINMYLSELNNGMVRDDAVYIMKSEVYGNQKDFYDNLPVRIVDKYDHAVFSKIE